MFSQRRCCAGRSDCKQGRGSKIGRGEAAPAKLTPALEGQVIGRAGKRRVSIRNTATWLQRKGMSVSREHSSSSTLKEDGLYPFHRPQTATLDSKHRSEDE